MWNFAGNLYRFPVLKEFGRSKIDKVTVIGLGCLFFWDMVYFLQQILVVLFVC